MEGVNASVEEIEAVKKLLSRLSPEDLEKAAGGISPRAKSLLITVGALTLASITSAVIINKYGKTDADLGGIAQTYIADEKLSNTAAREKIKNLNISKTLWNSEEVDKGGEHPWKVFDKWTYYDKKTGKIKDQFIYSEKKEQIYHINQTYVEKFPVRGFGKRKLNRGEEMGGVPISELMELS